jgi:biopolymer transport protein ExbB/TolQ
VIAGIEQIVFRVSQALRIPVIILSFIALAITLVELGSLTVELIRRRKRKFKEMEVAAGKARTFMGGGWIEQAIVSLRPVTWSNRMERTMEQLVRMVPAPRAEERISKTLADFDYDSLHRLESTRVLVRAGPALGLMGTLIPLAPGLAALAEGDVGELTLDLRLAFSLTILGLLIGAVAFGISLVRDRLYGQDLSDLEYMISVIAPAGETVTETDLVRALGKAPRRPGRHSRPDPEGEHTEQELRLAAAARAMPPTEVAPAATDTRGVRAGDAPAATAAGAVSPEPPGRALQPPVDDDRDYLTELTVGLSGLGDVHPEPGPNGDRRDGDPVPGAGTSVGEAEEEGRR